MASEILDNIASEVACRLFNYVSCTGLLDNQQQKQMHLRMCSAQWQLFCSGLIVFKISTTQFCKIHQGHTPIFPKGFHQDWESIMYTAVPYLNGNMVISSVLVLAVEKCQDPNILHSLDLMGQPRLTKIKQVEYWNLKSTEHPVLTDKLWSVCCIYTLNYYCVTMQAFNCIYILLSVISTNILSSCVLVKFQSGQCQRAPIWS